MRWRVAIRWMFAMVFFAAAVCASAHSEFDLQGQPAPACSHESSGEDQQPVRHCTECMQIHYLQESASQLGVVPMIAAPCFFPVSVQPVSFMISPVLRFAPPEPLASSPPVLRI
jgi:hypothetical protein